MPNKRWANRIWLFDVDGVISDAEQKRVTQPELLDALLDIMTSGEPLIFNTGRPVAWVMNSVMGPMKQRARLRGVDDPIALFAKADFAIFGEKGASRLTVRPDGSYVVSVDSRLALPARVQTKAAQLVISKYSDSMYIDESKDTMFTAEMRDGLKVNDFLGPQKRFAGEIRSMLRRYKMDSVVRVDETQIAVDLQHAKAGKALGARRAMEWLRRRGVEVGAAVAVGDSLSDIEMADELQRQKIPVEFVFVGGPEVELPKRNYLMTITGRKGELGTLSRLRLEKFKQRSVA